MKRFKRSSVIFTSVAVLALVVLSAVVIARLNTVTPKPAAPKSVAASGQVKSSTSVATTPATIPVPEAFDKKARSIDDSASVWVVANKLRRLNPASYAPAVAAPAMQLRLSASSPEMQVSTLALADLERLNAAAKAAGLPMMLASGYRSYQSQTAVYANEVKRYGQAQADRQSARPGHSEHQTGLAIDLAPASGKCLIAECFGELPEGQWLAAHAHEYGFIIRYSQGKEAITGYLYEPWHLRYVGSELAAEVNRLKTATNSSPTLEEFFGLPPAPNYQ